MVTLAAPVLPPPRHYWAHSMEYNWWLVRILSPSLSVFRAWAPPYFISRWWSYHVQVPKAALYLLCSNCRNSLISPDCSEDTPVTIEFPTDQGFSTSMSLRYLQAVLGFFRNARCITVGRSSPASARGSGPSDLKACMVNAVCSAALRACTFSTFVISGADMGVFPLMGVLVFGRWELLGKRYPCVMFHPSAVPIAM